MFISVFTQFHKDYLIHFLILFSSTSIFPQFIRPIGDFHIEGVSECIRHDFPSHANSFVWPILVTSVYLFDFHQTELGWQTSYKFGNSNDSHSLNRETSFFMRFVDTWYWYPFVDLNIRCICRPSREQRYTLRHSKRWQPSK